MSDEEYSHGAAMHARHTIIGNIMKLESQGRHAEARLLRKKLGGKWVLSPWQRTKLFFGRLVGFYPR